MSNVIPFSKKTTDQGDTARQILFSEMPSQPVVLWYHHCKQRGGRYVPMVRGFACRCGARSEQHDKGPHDVQP